jgi:hypothetical protein
MTEGNAEQEEQEPAEERAARKPRRPGVRSLPRHLVAGIGYAAGAVQAVQVIVEVIRRVLAHQTRP